MAGRFVACQLILHTGDTRQLFRCALIHGDVLQSGLESLQGPVAQPLLELDRQRPPAGWCAGAARDSAVRSLYIDGMGDPLVEVALGRLEQGRRVQAMRDALVAVLAGTLSRAELAAWTRTLWPPGSGQGGPFRSATAACIFDSICGIEERDAQGHVVREVDLRAYLGWLTEGESFLGEPDALVVLGLGIEALAARTGGTPVTHWLDGIGWVQELRFCTPASGRPYIAGAHRGRSDVLGVRKQQRDPWRDALLDLFEALAIDDRDVVRFGDEVDLESLPCWALWRSDDNGNKFEMERSRSYAKAAAQEQLYSARGHRQVYWVEPAR